VAQAAAPLPLTRSVCESLLFPTAAKRDRLTSTLLG